MISSLIEICQEQRELCEPVVVIQKKRQIIYRTDQIFYLYTKNPLIHKLRQTLTSVKNHIPE